MNDLQKTEFDLFKCFVDVCKKLDLNYFMLEGSALGAARHGGFIPWDDDLDVGMYRDDYNKFIEFAPALLPEGLFLQNYKSDPDYPLFFAKLRNSNTTYIEKMMKDFPINHGIYIDIFPLDGYPQKRIEEMKMYICKHYYSERRCCVYDVKRRFTGKVYFFFLKALGYGKYSRVQKTLKNMEKHIAKYPVNKASIICNHGSPYGKKDYIPAIYYGDGAEAVFEGMKVRIPADVDGYLTCLYGDWRTPLPPDKRSPRHPYEICDLEKPYTYYINKEKE